MPDIIHLLPDSVANQIAAGEVIQRPASAVKELLENAIDAGASSIKLIVKDAGKTLIQIIDDGCGMSQTDARMCFERHATSKIKSAEDLFRIRTMGFRGEAMASIAAVAQVEMKTKRVEDDLGTLLLIEGSEVQKQELISTTNGTSISIKNLFYNIPARRNFLKSNPVELRHIIDEFQRVALANASVFFSMHHDGQEIFHLPKGTLRQRIIHLFGNNYNERLVPVEEQSSIIGLKGFIGKPENARKTRGEQFFFVNNRFIKDGYLNHAVMNSYENLLPEDSYPLYVLFIDIDPNQIDINVHPTKTEIKFEDERSIYAIIRSAVKRSLGVHNIAPSLDFEQDPVFNSLHLNQKEIVIPGIKVDQDFNPFKTAVKPAAQQANLNLGNWELMMRKEDPYQPESETTIIEKDHTETITYQLHQRFILSHIKSGFIIIDQQAAHERILYERFLMFLDDRKGMSQQNLFPQTIHLSPADFQLVKELWEDIKTLGFDLREFGKNAIVIDGIPAEISQANHTQLLEKMLEDYKHNMSITKLDKRENLARALARNSAIKAGNVLQKEEMRQLIDELFACKMPKIAINGDATFITISLTELMKRFEK